MKKNDGIWKQIRENPKRAITPTDAKLKEAVDYVFKQQPRELAEKGEGCFINVYQDDDILSFDLGVSGKVKMKTGIRGFLNMIDMEDGWAFRLNPVKFNGEVLDDTQTEQFWQETERIKKAIKRKTDEKEQ